MLSHNLSRVAYNHNHITIKIFFWHFFLNPSKEMAEHKTFYYQAIQNWNHLPPDIKSLEMKWNYKFMDQSYNNWIWRKDYDVEFPMGNWGLSMAIKYYVSIGSARFRVYIAVISGSEICHRRLREWTFLPSVIIMHNNIHIMENNDKTYIKCINTTVFKNTIQLSNLLWHAIVV